MAAHLVFGEDMPSCPACVRGGEILRDRWGCDRKAPAPVYATTCPRCAGFDEGCPEPDIDEETGENSGGCGGSGEAWQYRCPSSQVRADVWDVVRSYSLIESGMLPDEGGFYDQSAAFVDAVSVIGGERAKIEEERRAEAERKAKAGRK